MDFVTPLISVFQISYDFIAKRVGHVVYFNKRAQKMVNKLEELKETSDDLKMEIEQAELRGLMRTKQANRWIERVEKTEVKVNNLLRSLPSQKGMKCFSKKSCFCSRYKVGKNSQKMEIEISELMKKKPDLGVSMTCGVQQINQKPSKPTIGLNTTLYLALQYIADDDVGMIGVYGMGGVGKTTLLVDINNEYLSRANDFEAVIWVTVSRECALDRIQHDLFSRLRLAWDETDSQEQCALKIYNFLARIKFLLLLDDVWEGLDLERIGIPLPNKRNKCKVVFTTRSMDVCTDMGASKNLKVEFLNEEDSWCLFCEKAGDSNVMNPRIKPYAQTLVNKCGGLPLALITVGRAMANRKTEEEWKYAIEVLNYAPSELRGMEDVFTLLKFSYENLQDCTLRTCFLYCALFPEDYPLEKEQLIDYWMWEGFLDGLNGSRIRNKGHAIIGSLKVACLLETDEEETRIKMHHVIRSFALWLASSGGQSRERFIVQGLPEIEKWEKACRVSLVDCEITMLSDSPVCPDLSTLLLNCNYSLIKISNDFFQFMPTLKVLDLSVTSIREIPKSIGMLIELRYLDLSRTKITTLPRELGCLSKLRHLDLQRTHFLQSIPKEIILGITNLRVLNLYCSYGEWEIPLCQDSRHTTTFQDLQHLRNLTSLGITVTHHSALKELSGYHNLLDCIEHLYIKGCEGLVYAMIASIRGGGERLRRLTICNCDTLKEVDMGSEPGKDWMPSLEVLVLHTLPNLTTIWRKSVTENCHRNLHYISIWHCSKLKNVSWILQLPNLEKLYVFYCHDMEEIIGENDVGGVQSEIQFPKLKTISFRNLPKLGGFSKLAVSFPMLQTFALIDCPQLKKLPSMGYDSSSLPIVYCSREWWDNLDWDDVTASYGLCPQFIAI